MIQRSAKQKRADWRKFYTYEKQFFEYVTENSTCLYGIKGCEPKYKIITTQTAILEKPPRWIRWIGYHHGDEQKLESQIRELRELYLNAIQDNKKLKLPARFVQYYSYADRIGLSINTAYQSIALSPIKDVVLREIPLLGEKKQRDDIISLTEKDETKLKKVGFASAKTSIEQRNFGQGFISVVCLSVSGQEFFKHFTAKAITARRETGRQYTAGIATDAEKYTKKISFGFILVGNSDCRVFKTTPKKPRADLLEKIAIRLELPVSTDFEFLKYNR